MRKGNLDRNLSCGFELFIYVYIFVLDDYTILLWGIAMHRHCKTKKQLYNHFNFMVMIFFVSYV